MGDVIILFTIFHHGLTLTINLPAMSTAELKLNLLERLVLVQDNGVLQRLKEFLDKEIGESHELTDEEVAELDDLRRRRLDGTDAYVPLDEAMRIAREALKK